MGKISFYHGTTLDNAINIIDKGFLQEKNRVWSLSEFNSVYAWTQAPGLPELKGADYDLENWINPFQLAIESASACAAIHNYLGKDLAVIEIEIDESEIDEIMEDESNPSKLEQAFVFSQQHAFNSIVKVHKVKNAYRPDLRFFYMHKGCKDYGLLDEQDLDTLNLFLDLDHSSIHDYIADLFMDCESETIFDKTSILV